MTAPVDDVWALWRWRVARTPGARLVGDDHGAAFTYVEMDVAARRLAARLRGAGIEPGTVVSWQLPTRATTVLLALALARLEAMQVPIIPPYGEREVGFVLVQTGATHHIAPRDWRGDDYVARATAAAARTGVAPVVHALEDLLADLDTEAPLADEPRTGDGADAVRWVYYTSGTTSEPKGVRSTDRAVIASAAGYVERAGLTGDDVAGVAFPWAHSGGSMYLGTALLTGMALCLVDKFDPPTTLATYRAAGVTITGGSTAFYQELVREQERQSTPVLPTLRLITGGAAPMPPEVYHEVRRTLGVKVLHGYGSTESMMCMGSVEDSDDDLATTVGRPIPGVELRVVRTDDDGTPGADVEPGESGEILVRGTALMVGYVDRRLDEASFVPGGWFRTGDLGLRRPDGRMVITGRLKDIIIRKGENVSARELEDLLYEHPKVADVAVIGLPDPERGERVCAVVQPARADDPLTLEEVVAYLRSTGLMPQKLPEQLELVDQLPRNATLQKVVKTELRARFADVRSAP